MSDDQERIADRINARQMAQEAIELFQAQDASPVWRQAFVENLELILLPDRIEEPKKPPAYRWLAKTVMPFGEHKGKPFDQVPVDYLDWLCHEQEAFYDKMRLYLKHPERPRDPEELF